jgi:hypothetical protein
MPSTHSLPESMKRELFVFQQFALRGYAEDAEIRKRAAFLFSLLGLGTAKCNSLGVLPHFFRCFNPSCHVDLSPERVFG